MAPRGCFALSVGVELGEAATRDEKVEGSVGLGLVASFWVVVVGEFFFFLGGGGNFGFFLFFFEIRQSGLN